jgi:hypothetical protein
MHLLDISSKHAIFLDKIDGHKFCIFRETKMEKVGIEPWIARMGSVAQCGGGERALKP